MAITFPYTSPNAQYGDNTYTKSWYPPSSSLVYNYTQVVSTGYSTINSFTKNADGTISMSITIYNNTNVIRSGYAYGTITVNSVCAIKLYNPTLNAYVDIYYTGLSASCADAVTTPITHSSTVNVTVPATWGQPANSTWRFNTVNDITSSTLFAYTHTKPEATFVIPSLAWTVRYADALYPVKGVWVRYADTLREAKDIKVNYNGVLK